MNSWKWLSSLIFPVFSLCAKPTGCVVAHGQATLSETGERLTIQTDNNAILNWNTFSIEPGESVRFDQPSSEHSVLNRVTSHSFSSLDGSLTSNGRVYLINPNGIYFGKQAIIDVQALIASTFDLTDEAFLGGNELFFAGDSIQPIINTGSITTRSGDLILVARRIENCGSLSSAGGTIGCITNGALLYRPNSKEPIFIEPLKGSPQSKAELYSFAIEHRGTIDAKETVQQGGRVFLAAQGGAIAVSGTISSRAITIDGERIELGTGAHIETAGGEIRIGSKQTDVTLLSLSTHVIADGLADGDGGAVHIYGRERLFVGGHCSARGGAHAGNGGLIDLSTDGFFDCPGAIDLTAPYGKTGMLILDPLTIIVQEGGSIISGNILFNETPSAIVSISNASLSTLLNAASVTLQANTDVQIIDDITATLGSNSLLLEAGRSITIDGGTTISLNGGNASFIINDEGANADFRQSGDAQFYMGTGSAIETNGGDITVSIGTFGDSQAGSILLDGTNTHLDADGGTIQLTGVNVSPAIALTGGAYIQTTGLGTVSLTGTGSSDASGEGTGISLSGSNTRITAAAAITCIGTLGFAGGGAGMLLEESASIESTGSGNISLTGNGGLHMLSGATVSASGTGATLLTAAGGDGNEAPGIFLFGSGTAVTSSSGLITLDGTGGSLGGSGIELLDGAQVVSTGTGLVTIDGTGGGGTSSAGVVLNGTNSLITVGNANLSITALGDANGEKSHGLFCVAGGQIASTGAGTITISATGADGDASFGALILGTNSLITSAIGNIDMTCTGTGLGAGNTGLSLESGGQITSTGSATITIEAQGGDGDRSKGITITGTNSRITSSGGDIDITGVGGGTAGSFNCGVFMERGGQITGTGNAGVSVHGTGGSANRSNIGIYLVGTGSAITTEDGSCSVTGIAGTSDAPGNSGVVYRDSATLGASGGGSTVVSGTRGGSGRGSLDIDTNLPLPN